jgi:hypothetical protein
MTHSTGKFEKQGGSALKRTVRDREKLIAYLEMSWKNKEKSPIFIGSAKSVLCSVTTAGSA